jgi:PBP1b-binding outer membrane lipoprotein LpoB
MKNTAFRSLGLITLIILLSISLLCGCSQKLSSDFDEEEVKKTTENVISLLNARDSEGVKQLCTAQMKDLLTDDVFSKIYASLDDGGNYQEIKDISIGGTTDKSSEEEFAVVVAKAKYEIRTFTFTITFTKQMKLAGLYYK